EGSADDAADGLARVQRGERVLEDHLHVPTPLAERPALQVRDVLALELDLALGHVVQPHDHASEGRLAAPGLAHEPDGLARVDVQVHTVDGVDVADVLLEDDPAGNREVLLDAAKPDQRLAGRICLRCRAFAHLDAHRRAMTSSWKMRSLSASDRWQADAWCPSIGISLGTSTLQRSNAYGQRGWNAQPGGTRISDGGNPLMGCRRSLVDESRREIEPSRPHV